MAKKTEEVKILTVAERREELERQLADLDVLENIEDEIKGLAKRYEDWYKSELTSSRCVGKEEEQAKNYDGELLFQMPDDYHTYTKAEIINKGFDFSDAKPYYRDKWETYDVTFDELSSYSQRRAEAYQRLANFFKNLDVLGVK